MAPRGGGPLLPERRISPPPAAAPQLLSPGASSHGGPSPGISPPSNGEAPAPAFPSGPEAPPPPAPGRRGAPPWQGPERPFDLLHDCPGSRPLRLIDDNDPVHSSAADVLIASSTRRRMSGSSPIIWQGAALI